MRTAIVKECRLNIRCDSRARELLTTAAAYSHLSVSEFVLSHALASAQKVVRANESITLNPEDFRAFLAALDSPAPTSPVLARAFECHAKQVSR